MVLGVLSSAKSNGKIVRGEILPGAVMMAVVTPGDLGRRRRPERLP